MTQFAKQRSYGVEIRAIGPNVEVDGIRCAHCGRVDWIKPKQSPTEVGALCTCCDRYVCRECHGGECMPLRHRLEQFERKGQGLRYDKREHLFDIFAKSGKVL